MLTTWEPATGPIADSTTSYDADSAVSTSMEPTCESQRKTQVGPDPLTMPRRAPSASPSAIRSPSSGRRSMAGSCRSLWSARASRTGSPLASAANSSVGLSTPEVYRHFDRLHPDAPAQPAEPTELLAALASGEPVRLARALHNDLQEPAIHLRPELGDLIALGEAEGALRGMVSGSGPTCVFLCDSQVGSMEVVTALSASYDVVLSAIGPVAGAHVVSTREAEWDLR